MVKDIKVSVLIPVYNSEKTLAKCLESILQQSLKEIEIIIVDDGSSDNSFNIIKNFATKDERIKCYKQENQGVTKTRNLLLKNALGKYCLNIDSDDWIEKDYLRAMYEGAEKDKLDMVICDIYNDLKNKKGFIIKDLKIKDSDIIDGDTYFKLFIKSNFYGYTCNKLIKRQILIDNNMFYNENIKFLCEDANFILKLCKHMEKIGKINKAYYHYVETDSNGTKKIKLNNLKDLNTCYNDLLKFYKDDSKKVYLLRESKLRNILTIIIQGEYRKCDGYDLFVKTFLKEIKRSPLSFEKFPRDKLLLIFLTNIIKIFPYLSIVKILSLLYRKIKEMR